jgi:hypothetical protein
VSRDDEKVTMALRPVSDSQKQDPTGGAESSELDAVAKLIADDARPETPPANPPPRMTEHTPEAEPAPKHTAAGWYPDDSDPTLMRYWDGHHLTGQTMRVDPATTDEEEPTEPAPSPQVDTAEPFARTEGTWTTLQSSGGSAPATVADAASDEEAAPEPEPEPEPAPVATAKTDDRTPVEMPDQWAEKAARTVARARTTSTPEAWQEVVSVVGVMSELAHTMMVVASAAQISEQANRMAEKARTEAEAADKAAVAARRASQQATSRAQEAQEAAKAAARAASDAMQVAQQAEQEAPEVAEVAEVAAREAAEAKTTFEEVERILAGAQAADTPEAWTEAHRLAAGAFGS